MKVKIILLDGTAFALTDKEAQDVEIEIVGCDDCSLRKWTEEVDEYGLNGAKNFTVRLAKD